MPSEPSCYTSSLVNVKSLKHSMLMFTSLPGSTTCPSLAEEGMYKCLQGLACCSLLETVKEAAVASEGVERGGCCGQGSCVRLPPAASGGTLRWPRGPPFPAAAACTSSSMSDRPP